MYPCNKVGTQTTCHQTASGPTKNQHDMPPLPAVLSRSGAAKGPWSRPRAATAPGRPARPNGRAYGPSLAGERGKTWKELPQKVYDITRIYKNHKSFQVEHQSEIEGFEEFLDLTIQFSCKSSMERFGIPKWPRVWHHNHQASFGTGSGWDLKPQSFGVLAIQAAGAKLPTEIPKDKCHYLPNCQNHAKTSG